MATKYRQPGAACAVALACLVLSSCDGCLATDECPGFIHRVDRLITIDDTRDTIRVGDTLTFSFLLPWVVTTRFSYELQDSFTFDLRDAPEPDLNYLDWNATFAPLGLRQEAAEAIYGNHFIEKHTRRGGDEVGYLVGDSTAQGLEAEMALVFRRPGRYFLQFSSARGQRAADGTVIPADEVEYDAYDLTRTDGCRERIFIHNVGANYDLNSDLAEAHNAASEVQMRIPRPFDNDIVADYYVLVTE